MATEKGLTRFLEAQNKDYETALREVKNGRKISHWMWYIFPQISGLGLSETARFYAIKDKAEAVAFLQHEILGSRLIGISNELLDLPTNNSERIFGSIDSLKLKSSMTLFSLLETTDPVFKRVLDKFYEGEKDQRTVELLNANDQPII